MEYRHFNRPALFITVVEQENSWVALGTNKMDLFELEASTEQWPEITSMSSEDRIFIPRSVEYLISGRAYTISTAVGSSPLSAIGALLDFLKEQEKEELRQNLAYSKRQEDLKRFGGEVNEELIRKVVRWRKKQAKRQEQQHRDWVGDY